MNCFGMHVCGDELFALLMVVPFVSIYGRRLSVWWHARRARKAAPACECPSMHGKKR